MAASEHAVHLYSSSEEFRGAVAEYLNDAVANGRPAVAILTADNCGRVARLLDAPEGVRFLDADETLAAMSEDGVPVAARFDEIVGGAIDELAVPGKKVAAVGEMVELLVARGEPATAISLEELWNSLAWSRDFTLLCGYRRDRFAAGAQADVLAEIVRTHAHVLPAAAA
jgi:MEDS: MEthanogen/methylotroph, DcmR Sensory domain